MNKETDGKVWNGRQGVWEGTEPKDVLRWNESKGHSEYSTEKLTTNVDSDFLRRSVKRPSPAASIYVVRCRKMHVTFLGE